MKTSELIHFLQEMKKRYGDTEIFLSTDEEGNGYGTLNVEGSLSFDEKKIIFYPFEEGLQYEDLPQSKKDIQEEKEWQELLERQTPIVKEL